MLNIIVTGQWGQHSTAPTRPCDESDLPSPQPAGAPGDGREAPQRDPDSADTPAGGEVSLAQDSR